MESKIETAVLLRPKCTTCGTEKPKVWTGSRDGWNQHFFICPHCWKQCCNQCFKPDLDDDGHTFFCSHCKTKLKFP